MEIQECVVCPEGMDMMAGLTDAQKACIEWQNCSQVQMPSMGERPEMGNPQAAGEKKHRCHK